LQLVADVWVRLVPMPVEGLQVRLGTRGEAVAVGGREGHVFRLRGGQRAAAGLEVVLREVDGGAGCHEGEKAGAGCDAHGEVAVRVGGADLGRGEKK
jgi:hypothetical protein